MPNLSLLLGLEPFKKFVVGGGWLKVILVLSLRLKLNNFKLIFAGINKGSAIFLHLLKELSREPEACREVAFYHRNTSDDRKQSILADLQLPLGSAQKRLLCVVATVSLGVGVDIRVDNVVAFGLADTAENLLQEGGRAMRGSQEETAGKHGYAYFFQRGRLGTIKISFMAFLENKN